MADDGLERLRRWREQDRGVPPAFGRLRASFDEVSPGTTAVRLPLHDELRAPGSAAVTCVLADFGLTTSVIASLPDLRGVTTVSMTVDHLAPVPEAGALVVRCTAQAYADGRPQHAIGTLHDDTGRLVAQVSGWFLAAPAEQLSAERVGLVHEAPARDLRDLLQVGPGAEFALHARDALSNALGTLHGAVGAAAAQLAAEAALDPGLQPLTSTFVYLRPTPRDGSVHVAGRVVRQGRRTGLAESFLTGPDGRVVLQASLVAG